MNADGANIAQLTDNNFDEFWPEWSPDGQRIAFSWNRDGNPDIYLMNADGTGVVQLTNER